MNQNEHELYVSFSSPDPKRDIGFKSEYMVCSDYCKKCDRLQNRFEVFDLEELEPIRAEKIKEVCCFCGGRLTTMIGA